MNVDCQYIIPLQGGSQLDAPHFCLTLMFNSIRNSDIRVPVRVEATRSLLCSPILTSRKLCLHFRTFFAPLMFPFAYDPPTFCFSAQRHKSPLLRPTNHWSERGRVKVNPRETDGKSWFCREKERQTLLVVVRSTFRSQENRNKRFDLLFPLFFGSTVTNSPCLASMTPGFITATALEVERDPAWTKADRRGSTSRSGSESSCASLESEQTVRDSPINTGETVVFYAVTFAIY